MYKKEECSQSDYHLLRLMAWHRKNFTYAILKTFGEEGEIDWVDYPYYSPAVSNYRELAPHGFQFLREKFPVVQSSFKDFTEVFPTEKPIEPLWNCIGITSSSAVIFVSIFPRQIQSTSKINENQKMWFGVHGSKINGNLDYIDAKRLAVLLYLNKRGIRSKQIDLILVNSECDTEEYALKIEKLCRYRETMYSEIFNGKSKNDFFYRLAIGLDGVKRIENL